jgi:hypothetical protein
MTMKMFLDSSRCWHLAEGDAPVTEGTRRPREPETCAPVIDAEKCNEALRMVAQIRGRSIASKTRRCRYPGITGLESRFV